MRLIGKFIDKAICRRLAALQQRLIRCLLTAPRPVCVILTENENETGVGASTEAKGFTRAFEAPTIKDKKLAILERKQTDRGKRNQLYD